MKKRILALALACLMLVSMFPMAIFAADVTCPGKGKLHTEAHVAIAEHRETVPASGCEGGHKLYVCNECDTPFMIDTNPDTHDYQSASNVEPKCNENGKKNREVCSICDDERFTVWEKGTEWHSWKKIDGQFYKDETPLYRCEYCDEEKGSNACTEIKTDGPNAGSHTWEGVTPQILVAPTDTEDGKAKFTCTVCKFSEEVTMHNHILEKHDAKAVSCINKGNREYYTCDVEDCLGKFYLNETNANAYVATAWSSIELTEGVRQDHAWDTTNFTAYTPSNCTTKPATPESWVMWCSICEDYFTKPGEIYHNAAEQFCTNATCFNAGAHYYYCADCKTTFADADCANKPTDKITANHTAGTPNLNGKLDASLASFLKIDGKQYTCWKVESAVKAGTNTSATNRTCTEGLKVTVSCSECDATHEFNIPAATHSIVTVKVDATCATLGFTYNKCTNDNCPTMTTGLNAEIQSVIAALVADGKLEAAANVIENTAVYTDGNASDTIIEMVKDSACAYIAGTVVINTEAGLDANTHIKNEKLTNAPTCTADGTKNWNCIYCAANDFGETVSKLNHQMGPATKIDGVDLVSGRHYTYTHSVCQRTGCDMDPATEGDQPHTIDGEKVYLDLKAIYDSLEDSVENYHHVYDGEGLNAERPADCALGTPALQSYVCEECGKKITVKVPNSEYHLIDGSKCDCAFCDKYNGQYYTGAVKDANYVAPTCGENGYWREFHCANVYCKTYDEDDGIAVVAPVIDEDSKLSHNFKAKFEAVSSDCETNGMLAIYECENGCGTYKTNTHEHGGFAPEVNLFNAVVEATMAARDPKWHSNSENFTFNAAVPADCYNDGTIEYYQCKHCDKKYAVDDEDKENALSSVKDPQKSHTFAMIQDVPVICALEQFAFKHYNCTQPGCDEEYIVAYVPAPIHTKGDRIEDATVKMDLDKFEADENGTTVNTYLAPTCTLNGYQFYECAVTEGCYYIEHIDALGHINREGDNLSDCKNNDETLRDCVRCNTNDIEKNNGHMNWVPVYDEIWDPEYDTEDAVYETFYVHGHKDATCFEDGWDAYVCSHCKYKDEERTEVDGKHEHTLGTPQWDGTKNTWYKVCVCDDCECDYSKDVTGSGIALSMTASNALVNGAVYTDASTIKLTVKASGMPAASIGGIEFTVDFDDDKVAFAGFKAVGSKFEITTAKVNVDDPEKVTAVLLSAGTVELGTTAEAVVELYFTVKTPNETEITFGIDSEDVIATPANAKDKYFAKDVTNVSVETKALMDIDDNGKVDVRDLVALYNLTKKPDAAAAYTAVGDLNRDGELKLRDLEILADYIAAGASVGSDAYLKIVGRSVES